jgi:predicted hydrocarbon binding protein
MFIDWQDKLKRVDNRVALFDIPIAMHCHHYNINLEKMLEDILGKEGVQLMYRAAEESNHTAFKIMLEEFQRIRSDKSKLEFAASIYQHCGLGVINFQDAGPDGGRIISPSSHHVTGWLAKHGLRKTPGCHFTRGWIAGVLEAIYDLPTGYFEVMEMNCKMMRSPVCEFDVRIKKDPYGH